MSLLVIILSKTEIILRSSNVRGIRRPKNLTKVIEILHKTRQDFKQSSIIPRNICGDLQNSIRVIEIAKTLSDLRGAHPRRE